MPGSADAYGFSTDSRWKVWLIFVLGPSTQLLAGRTLPPIQWGSWELLAQSQQRSQRLLRWGGAPWQCPGLLSKSNPAWCKEGLNPQTLPLAVQGTMWGGL